ncbi:hypothetical protein Pmani_016493 [Petrolisthes manimaculis]|uniref:Uncharacterized protein n=1 Tax=Petrolisthes manimaculis TaxID=1843537 RepID=A0AAE1UAZ2_9EUCA|nr:hypothetical protein Pmani_016493 [Petrolisthes manimaculis]
MDELDAILELTDLLTVAEAEEEIQRLQNVQSQCLAPTQYYNDHQGTNSIDYTPPASPPPPQQQQQRSAPHQRTGDPYVWTECSDFVPDIQTFDDSRYWSVDIFVEAPPPPTPPTLTTTNATITILYPPSCDRIEERRPVLDKPKQPHQEPF